MTKKYRLLKDLPTLKANPEMVIFEKGDDPSYPANRDYSYCYGSRRWWLSPLDVENNPEWFEEVKPEKITVDVHGVSWVEGKAEKLVVVTNPSRLIQTELFPAIKSAIENVLNGTSTLFDCNQELMEQMSKMYTEKDLELVFYAARQMRVRNSAYNYIPVDNMVHPYFEDYLSTLNKQSPCK